MDKVSKFCDLKVTRRRDKVACGQPVPDDQPTYVTFGTTRYGIDLCAEHQETLTKSLQPYLDVASDAQMRTGTHVRKALQGRGGKPFTTKDVREWLASEGREVPARGRLPEDILREYEQAHS
jgi:hypothetical protein